MDAAKLKEILEKHLAWLRDEDDGARADLTGAKLTGADLRSADLRSADLTGADLRSADLTRAGLRSADLTGAKLDFSSLPLWCGSFDMIVDRRIAAQIAYHFCRLNCDDEEVQEAQRGL
ncbi:MAG: pentapeptide repeat-containing protein, partial [bacterium]|nr:pentapeptide repeat-containing protein [bacterium]